MRNRSPLPLVLALALALGGCAAPRLTLFPDATDPYREPDFGEKVVGPAGATVIGARDFLVAYNIYLTTADVSMPRREGVRA